MIQLIANIKSDRPAMGQRSGPSGEIALPTLPLSPMPASSIGRIQHEQAARTAPTLLSMLKTVVLAPPGWNFCLGITWPATSSATNTITDP